MKKQGNMSQTKEQDKSPEANLNKMELSDLPDREFKIMVIKLLIKVRGEIYGQNDFSANIENTKKYQRDIIEPKNIITDLKTSIKEFNSRLDQAEESVSKLKNRVVEIVQSEQ